MAAAAAPDVFPNIILVVLGSDVPDDTIAALAAANGLESIESIALPSVGLIVYAYSFPPGTQYNEVKAPLDQHPAVVWTQPNYLWVLSRSELPEHPLPRLEEALDQYALRLIRARQAQEMARGAGVVVGIVDTAIDGSHAALRGKLLETVDLIGPGSAKRAEHGTALAGIIAAEGRIRGIAPRVGLYAVRAFDDRPGGRDAAVSSSIRLAQAIDLCLRHGVQVLNFSFAGPRDPLVTKLVEKALENGITVVAAAGNEGPGGRPAYPAALDGVIAVTATDHKDRLYGRATRGAYVTVAAPGVDIVTTAPGGGLQYLSGTSMATAYVSGLAALLLERRPGLSPGQVKALIEASALDLGAPDRDPEFGAGRVDALSALNALAAADAAR
jgi:subtilisin family serine protease